MNALEILMQQSGEIERRLCYVFKDKKLMALAFVHRSFFNEHREDLDQHNERLEFLGDTILGLLVSEYLYLSCPLYEEGVLSSLRSHLVEASACAAFVQKLNVSEFLLLGKGERRGDGRGRETILADLFEALIGAIYLDGGFEAARAFFFTHFHEEVRRGLEAPTRNWKAELQNYSQKRYQKPPFYKVLKETGPDHNRIFHVAAILEDQALGEGVGPSKKQAEQAAAEDAISRITNE
jgi:ribonuclease III